MIVSLVVLAACALLAIFVYRKTEIKSKLSTSSKTITTIAHIEKFTTSNSKIFLLVRYPNKEGEEMVGTISLNKPHGEMPKLPKGHPILIYVNPLREKEISLSPASVHDSTNSFLNALFAFALSLAGSALILNAWF